MDVAVRTTRARVQFACSFAVLSTVAAVGCTRIWPAMEDCRATESTGRVQTTFNDWVDVLFVIDDGPSMTREQALLARELPRMVDALLQGADLDEYRHVRPLGSLHAGVVSADLGAGGLATRFAGCSVIGDDGVLRRSLDCGTDGRPFVWHFDGFHDRTQALEEIACNARVGAEGCAIAQPLEAALKSILPLDPPGTYPELDRVVFAGQKGTVTQTTAALSAPTRDTVGRSFSL